LLLHTSVQIAIVGAGNKNYGFIRKNGIIINLIDIFKKLNIKYLNSIQAKLADDDLTPRRLVRFFRYQIRNFLVENKGISSYLWRKYGNSFAAVDTMRFICFPGAEHLVEDGEEIKFFISNL